MNGPLPSRQKKESTELVRRNIIEEGGKGEKAKYGRFDSDKKLKKYKKTRALERDGNRLYEILEGK